MIPRYTTAEMEELWSEERKFKTWLEVEIAVCEVQAERGLIPKEDMKAIREKAAFEVERIREIESETQHDVIAFLSNVAEHVGNPSRHIHFGMTSSDLLDTALALTMKKAGVMISDDLSRLEKVIKAKVIEHRDTVMVGRTHGMHAEPVTFGLKLAVWLEEVRRHVRRWEAACENISVGQLSGAVGTYQFLDIEVEEAVCERLGLRPVAVSTQVIQRDRHAEYMSVLALIAASLEKFATEIRHLQRTEVGEAEEPFGSGQKGSSAMPHKRNPITCEKIAGLARVVRADSHAALENVALWHERDITHSSVERVIIPDATTLVDYCLRAFADLLEHIVVYPERMQHNLESTQGLHFSEAVLLRLVERGMARDAAYRIVQRCAMKATENGQEFRGCLEADSELTEVLSPREIEECFDIRLTLKNVDKILERVGLEE